VEKYTTDASVILKWVLGDKAEADQKKAMALLTGWVEGTWEIFVPVLWQFEVGNFLVTADGAFVRKMAGLSKISLLKDLGLK